MSARLTTAIREAIADDLIKHRFEGEVKGLYALRASLADAVYRDLYTKAQREQMDGLPDGMLPAVSDLGVTFGASYGRVYFSGFGYGDLNNVVPLDRNSECRRVHYKHKGGTVKVYEAGHKLSLEHERLSGITSDLVNGIDAARRAAMAAMTSVGTVKRLIEVWPEVEPFAKRFDTDRPKLPMVQADQLNTILGLPVSEAA